MHCVVNHIPIAPGADWDELIRLFGVLSGEILPGHSGVIGMHVIRASETELILVITFSDAESMANISSNIAGPWFAECIRPFMSGAADRKTGDLLVHYKPG